MNLLFEEMIRAETEQLICRIWRAQIRQIPETTTNAALKQSAIELLAKPFTFHDMAKWLIAGHPSINSVEIIDRATGDGVCIHKDWP